MYKQAIINELNTLADVGLKSTWHRPVDPTRVGVTIEGKEHNIPSLFYDEDAFIKGLDDALGDKAHKKIDDGEGMSYANNNVRFHTIDTPHTWKSRGRQLAAIGSITGGSTLGGIGGYYGSNALSKYIGLKGGGKENDFLHKRLGIDPNSKYRRYGDITLRTLGTLGGAALGGYGGAVGMGYGLLKHRDVLDEDNTIKDFSANVGSPIERNYYKYMRDLHAFRDNLDNKN